MQITGKKQRALVKRQLEFIAEQIDQLQTKREDAVRGFNLAIDSLSEQEREIRAAIAAYDAPKGEG